MFLSDFQAKFLRIGTTVIFVFTFIVAIFVVNGYRFDSGSQQLVKKSVILFDDSLKDYTVKVNSEVHNGVDRELRLVPGTYTVSLEAPESYTWQKTISLSDDALIRLGRPWLIPLLVTQPQTSGTVFDSSWSMFLNPRYAFSYKIIQGVVTIHVHDLTSEAEHTLTVEGFLPKLKIVSLAYDAQNQRLYVLDSKKQLWQASETKQRFDTKKLTATQLIQDDAFIGYLNEKGSLTMLTGERAELDGFTLQEPFVLESVIDVVTEAPYTALVVNALRARPAGSAGGGHGASANEVNNSRFAGLQNRSELKNNKKQNIQLVVVVADGGEVIFADAGSAVFIMNKMISYVHENKLMLFNPRDEEVKISLVSDSITRIRSIRPLGKTLWRILSTTDNSYKACDAWIENCITLGTSLDPLLITKDDGFTLVSAQSGKLLNYNFDPTHKTAPPLLKELIQVSSDSSSSATSAVSE